MRYLYAKKSHKAVNVITLIAVIGVAVATMAMVLALSIFNGFKDLAVSQLSNLDPDISIVPGEGKLIESSDSLAAAIRSIDGVEWAMPSVTERALLDDGNTRVPVVLKGVGDDYADHSGIEDIMIAGEYATATNDGMPAIQLSVGVANNVQIYPSAESVVRLYVPRRKGRINPANPGASFRSEEFAFSGVFRVSNSDVDADHVIVPLDYARDLLDYDDMATSVDVVVSADANVERISRAISEKLGDHYKALGRLEQHADSFRMISVEKWVTFMMLVCILAIALFNVVSTLSLLAIEKRDNMWTLTALGASQAFVRKVFITEGFLVTVTGGIIGIAAGIILALLQQIFHIVKLSADASSLTISHYPVRLEFTDIAAVAGVVVTLALITGLVARLIVRPRAIKNS